MLFRTHIVFSLAVYLVLNYFIEMPWIVLFFVLLATIFVDIDIRNSRVGNHWYLRPIQWLTRHRGVFHSLFFALLISLIVASTDRWAGFGFFVGYISHLFLDCLTRSGVALFWPLGFRLKGPIKSGGVAEEIMFVLLLLGDIFIVGKVVLEQMGLMI